MAAEWLTADEAHAELGLSVQTLNRWRRNRALAYHRERPRVRRERRRLHDRGRRVIVYLFHRSSLEELLKSAALARTAATDDQWLDEQEVRREFGYGSRTLWGWARHGCRYLPAGRNLDSRLEVRPAGKIKFRDVRTYSRDDLVTIAKSRPLRPGNGGDGDWLDAVQARKRFGFHQTALRRWHEGKRRCPLGRPLDARKRLLGVAGRRATNVWQYLTTDLEDIARVLGRSFPPRPAIPKPVPLTESGKRRGRPPNKAVEEVYAFCYRLYHKQGLKSSVVRRKAVEQFGEARAPKADWEVIRSAKRHASRHGLPLSSHRGEKLA